MSERTVKRAEVRQALREVATDADIQDFIGGLRP
jgi:hypothetical protein